MELFIKVLGMWAHHGLDMSPGLLAFGFLSVLDVGWRLALVLPPRTHYNYSLRCEAMDGQVM